MHFGLTLSLLLHGGALAWAYLAMLGTEPLEPPQPDEAHLTVSAERSPDEESADVVTRLGLAARR